MINPQWLEQPMFRTNFNSPKDIRAIEVRLYISWTLYFMISVQNNLYYSTDRIHPTYSDRQAYADRNQVSSKH